MDPQVGKCKSFASTHYLANVFACAVAHRQAYIASLRWHNGSNIVPDSHPFHSKSNDPPIPKIWLFENFTMKIQIWWSLLEWVVSYCAGKLGVYAPTDTGQTDASNDNIWKTKLALDNDLPISEKDSDIFNVIHQYWKFDFWYRQSNWFTHIGISKMNYRNQ